jgi:FtsP/CotA-like multicopper oxidase with cupredoxin domain
LHRRLLHWFVFIVFLVSWVGAAPAASGSLPKPAEHPCGPLPASHALEQPPDVDMWKAPLDARGEHELILAAHEDGDRFCYRYSWNGVVETTAPTIHVRPGERFAMRIVNDISGQAKGESVPTTGLPPCEPMMMPMDAPVEHWMGYLNHIIDDRRMPISGIDTNLHLHGFEGPAAMENVFLSTLSTPMHACEYDITIPLTQPPGTYLYHPHAHGVSDDEVAGGLDGAWIVEPGTPELPGFAQHVLIIRYRIPFKLDNKFHPHEAALVPLAENRERALPAATPVPYDPFGPPPWPVTYPMHAGDLTLDPTGCNGLASEPLVSVDGAETPALLQVPAGQTQLLRIVNGTSDTAKLIELRDGDGRVLPLHVTALDGVPISGDLAHPLARYLSLDKVMLSPMSRADVLLTVPAASTYTISSEHYCSGSDEFFQMHHELVDIEGVPGADPPATAVSSEESAAQTPAAKLVAFAHAHPNVIHRRAITFTEYIFPKKGKIPAHQAFYITDTTNPDFHEHPFWPTYRPGAAFPDNPDIVVKQGSIEEWYLINATMETHAFHIHQMAFVEERSYMGVPVTVDTVFVPVGKLLRNPRDPNYPLVQPSITGVLLDFRHVPKGEFLFHCHMLYHEDRGMMAVIRVD